MKSRQFHLIHFFFNWEFHIAHFASTIPWNEKNIIRF